MREDLCSGIILTMKRSYELMLLLKPDVEEKDTKKRDDIIKKLLSDATYTLTSTKSWGKKELAYPIAHQIEATYVLCLLEGENLSIGSIETKAKLDPTVLRFLLTRVE